MPYYTWYSKHLDKTVTVIRPVSLHDVAPFPDESDTERETDDWVKQLQPVAKAYAPGWGSGRKGTH